MLDLGFLPGETLLGIFLLLASLLINEKSVNWLLRKKPPTVIPDPKANSILLVNETAFPFLSIILIWVVEGLSKLLLILTIPRS